MVLEAQKNQPEPPVNGNVARKAERRSRPRAALHWLVHVLRDGSQHPVASRTRNVSSQGFYCLVEEPFESGERVECTVVVPIPKSSKPDDVLWLKCQARVLRVEAAAVDTAFGIAFQIEEYCVVHLNPMQISPAGQLNGDGLAGR
jgi:hypothetical protein